MAANVSRGTHKRVHHHVIHLDCFQLHVGHDPENIATDEQVRPGAIAEGSWNFMPKIAGINSGALEMQHAVIFGNDVQITSSASHSRQFANHAIRMRNGLQHMPAHSEVKRAVSELQLKNALMLEFQARGQTRVALAGKF